MPSAPPPGDPAPADGALPASALREVTGRPLSFYVHVPFCRHRCDYCAFATWTDRHDLAGRYLEACRRQVREAASGLPPVTSVFVGGGTPSLVEPEALLDVLAAVPLAPGAEVTLECNPDDLDPARVAAYVQGGVTRLSIGVQSMVPGVLRALGREHQPDNVRRAAEAAHAAGVPFNVPGTTNILRVAPCDERLIYRADSE